MNVCVCGKVCAENGVRAKGALPFLSYKQPAIEETRGESKVGGDDATGLTASQDGPNTEHSINKDVI